jgi:ATP/maltotriose-dependent transcriptional regulator MalT
MANPGENDVGITDALWVLGFVAEDEGRFDEAEALQKEVLSRSRAEGRTFRVALALNALGVTAYERGAMAQAADRFEAALDSFRTHGNAYGMGYSLMNLARVARERGDYARAGVLCAESLALRWEQGDKVGIAGCLRGLASVAVAARQYERAARLWGAAESLREAIGAPPPRHHPRQQQAIAEARGGLGEAEFAAAWAAGGALPLAEAVAEALATPEPPAAPAKPAAPADSFGLTAREVEVLRLVRAGLSNREIGERLFIAERTAQTHVQHIFDKLHVSTRAEAAAAAVEHGLL